VLPLMRHTPLLLDDDPLDRDGATSDQDPAAAQALDPSLSHYTHSFDFSQRAMVLCAHAADSGPPRQDHHRHQLEGRRRQDPHRVVARRRLSGTRKEAPRHRHRHPGQHHQKPADQRGDSPPRRRGPLRPAHRRRPPDPHPPHPLFFDRHPAFIPSPSRVRPLRPEGLGAIRPPLVACRRAEPNSRPVRLHRVRLPAAPLPRELRRALRSRFRRHPARSRRLGRAGHRAGHRRGEPRARTLQPLPCAARVLGIPFQAKPLLPAQLLEETSRTFWYTRLRHCRPRPRRLREVGDPLRSHHPPCPLQL